jgi:hypothetical protein
MKRIIFLIIMTAFFVSTSDGQAVATFSESVKKDKTIATKLKGKDSTKTEITMYLTKDYKDLSGKTQTVIVSEQKKSIESIKKEIARLEAKRTSLAASIAKLNAELKQIRALKKGK